MGTTIYQDTTRRKVIEEVLQENLPASRNLRILKHAIRGCCLWYLAQTLSTNEKWIGLVLIRGFGKGEFGVKHLDETFDPLYHSCPLSWLDECTEPRNDNARKWRETVRSKAQVMAEKTKLCRSLIAGQSVVYGSRTYMLLCKLAGRRGWIVREAGSGVEYRMKQKQLAASSLAV